MPESATTGPPANTALEISAGRVRLRISLAVILVCMYTPYSWVLWIDYPWSDYRWQWIMMWPILPGLVPAVFLEINLQRFFGIDGAFAERSYLLAVAGVFAIVIVAALTWFGMRGRRSLVAAAIIATIVSILCALGAYGAFRA